MNTLGNFRQLIPALAGTAVVAVMATAILNTPADAAGPKKNGTTLAASKTIDICEVDAYTWRYSGEISVWNDGVLDTQGLSIEDCIQFKPEGGQFVNTYCASGFDPAVQEIPAGTTQPNATTFAYSIDADPLLDGDIRNAASVTILNHSGSLGTAKGPQPKATWAGEVQPCNTDSGCALTQGFWKNHESDWPAGNDPNAEFYLSGQTWLQVLDTSPSVSQGYYQLAHQYIAAVLNQANGASVPSGVQDILTLAADFFATSAQSACPTAGSCGTQKTWAGILDDYNNGNYPGGPPHCGS